MSNSSTNHFISFYGKHHVSPVHQDINDFNKHVLRREKLYRTLGIPPIAFKDKTILEVGPGGGYNSLVFFKWGARVDFVEPNPKAQEELPQLLGKHQIEPDNWRLFKEKIEDFKATRHYDVIIAEGFLPGIPNHQQIVEKISGLVSPGGVVVVTCIDDISFFFENLKRLVAVKLVSQVEDFWDKVRILSRAFSSHLAQLKYATRPIEDWVIDQMLNPALYCDLFGINDCIDEFGNQFHLLGSSPQMFVNYSWYKDLDYDNEKSVLEQFDRKRHLLMKTGLEETIRNREQNQSLFDKVSSLRKFSREVEENFNETNLGLAIGLIKSIRSSSEDLSDSITSAIDESIRLLSDPKLTPDQVAGAKRFAAAFGRGQQYVSIVKKTL